MNILKSFVQLLFIIGVFSFSGFAQKVGTTSMQFLKVMPCARATAMGDAYSVLASGAEAVFWNPASITPKNSLEFSNTYMQWMNDTRIEALSASYSLGNIGSVGVLFQYVDYGKFDEAIRDAQYANDITPFLTGSTFRPYAMVVGVSYAAKLTDKFSTGVGAKFAVESLYGGKTVRAMTSKGVYEDVSTTGSGVSFDFGMHYNTGYKSIQLAIALQNFGPDVEYAKDKNSIPMQFRWGLAANLLGKDAIVMENHENRIGVAFDLFQPNDYAQQEHLGLEYEFKETFAVRVGYKFNYDSEGLSFGAGVKWPISTLADITIDYSYGSVNNDLGDVHRFSIGVGL